MNTHLFEASAGRRLLYGALVGLGVGALPVPLAAASHGLLAWSVGSFSYLCMSWWLAASCNAQRTRARAQAQDPPGAVLLALLLLSVLASMLAIGLMLQYVKDWSPAERLAHLALSMCALASSWLLMQTTFAFRYAHVYYRERGQIASKGAGLIFPGSTAPDYLDFLYYAFVVGMTSQVSDVVVTSKIMRHWTLLHSVIAFAFNMLVLALSINVMAGAI
jgi:uncharacterized membrane protein